MPKFPGVSAPFPVTFLGWRKFLSGGFGLGWPSHLQSPGLWDSHQNVQEAVPGVRLQWLRRMLKHVYICARTESLFETMHLERLISKCDKLDDYNRRVQDMCCKPLLSFYTKPRSMLPYGPALPLDCSSCFPYCLWFSYLPFFP